MAFGGNATDYGLIIILIQLIYTLTVPVIDFIGFFSKKEKFLNSASIILLGLEIFFWFWKYQTLNSYKNEPEDGLQPSEFWWIDILQVVFVILTAFVVEDKQNKNKNYHFSGYGNAPAIFMYLFRMLLLFRMLEVHTASYFVSLIPYSILAPFGLLISVPMGVLALLRFLGAILTCNLQKSERQTMDLIQLSGTLTGFCVSSSIFFLDRFIQDNEVVTFYRIIMCVIMFLQVVVLICVF